MVQFCEDCGTMMTKVDDEWYCNDCDGDELAEAREETSSSHPRLDRPSNQGTDLESLPTTDAGSVRKDDAMRWLETRDEPSPGELRETVVSKPYGFTGSTYAEAISNVRVTGDPAFIEAFAGLLKPFLAFEDSSRRLEINLQQVEDRDTGEQTGNYALYLSVADRA